MRRARWGILAGALAALVATPARADDKAMRDAQARFVEGLARVKAGDFEAARLSFAQAYVVLHKPDILWNLALSEEKSGHLVDALSHFKELGRDASPAEDRAKAKRHVDALMAQTGHIEVVAPQGAKVDVDGAAAGVTPLAEPVDVPPGKHHVVVGENAADTDVVAGQVARVSFLVADHPSPLPGAAGVESPPPAPEAPSSPAPAPVTKEAAAPEKDDDGSIGRTVTVVALGTLAVAGGALGVVFGVESQNNANTAAGLRGTDPTGCSTGTGANCAQLKDAVDAENRDHTLSVVSYAVGGALAVGAVATWLLWPKHARTQAAWVVPVLGPREGGVGLAGRF